MSNRIKTRYFHVYGKAKSEDGSTHVITVVAKLEQTRVKTEIVEDADVETFKGNFIKGELRYNIKKFKRTLTLGMSICHPSDTFDEEVGVEIAKARIEKGYDLGKLETNNVTMLTDDAIMAELMVKLNHIASTIDDYISED